MSETIYRVEVEGFPAEEYTIEDIAVDRMYILKKQAGKPVDGNVWFMTHEGDNWLCDGIIKGQWMPFFYSLIRDNSE